MASGATIATAFVDLRVDTRGTEREAADGATKAAKSATAAFARYFSAAVFIDQTRRAVAAASELEQAVGGSKATFGAAQKTVDQFAQTSAKSFGLSQRAALELTSQIGALLKGLGFTKDEAATTSVEIAKLGADLAAAFGGSPEDAVAALGAALRGEMDPLERFGVALNQAAVNTKAVEMGLASSTSQVDASAKAQATLALIWERTTDVQGQFAREANTAAGQQARLKASFEDLQAQLGGALLPTFAKLVTVTGGAVSVFSALPGHVQTTVVALAGVAIMAGPIKNVATAFGALTTVVKANPYALVATAAVAAGAALVAFANRTSDAEEQMRRAKEAAKELVGQISQLGARDAMKGAIDQFVRDNETFRRALVASGVTIDQLTDSALNGEAFMVKYGEAIRQGYVQIGAGTKAATGAADAFYELNLTLDQTRIAYGEQVAANGRATNAQEGWNVAVADSIAAQQAQAEVIDTTTTSADDAAKALERAAKQSDRMARSAKRQGEELSALESDFDRAAQAAPALAWVLA